MNWSDISKLIDESEKTHPTMDITTEEGNYIVFKYPENGSEYESDVAVAELLLNGVYTIKNVNIGSYKSFVELEEVPGIEFNTVHFANLEEEN